MSRAEKGRAGCVIARGLGTRRVVETHVARHDLVGAAVNEPNRRPGGEQANGVSQGVATFVSVRAATEQLSDRAVAETLPVAGDEVADRGEGPDAHARGW